MARIGAHQSVAGGLHLAFDRLSQVGGEVLQVFTRNQRQWQAPPLSQSEVDSFVARWQEAPSLPVFSHASYLINLATPVEEQGNKSLAALVAELQRCAKLGIGAVVLHPGAHGGLGVEAGLTRVVERLDLALEKSGGDVKVLLETTAGQGTSLGSSFSELGWLLSASRYPERLAVCLDTCHLFAAGYDLSSEDGYLETMAELKKAFGFAKVELIHLNDSKAECGQRVDRHEHIGQGKIGLAGFRRLLTFPRLATVPMVLETPKGDNLAEDVMNLQTLRSLLPDVAPRP